LGLAAITPNAPSSVNAAAIPLKRLPDVVDGARGVEALPLHPDTRNAIRAMAGTECLRDIPDLSVA
jgi:hypothetical protein